MRRCTSAKERSARAKHNARLKYGDLRLARQSPSEHAGRIERAHLALPGGGTLMASDDTPG
ncbi:MAG TPA: hypothetical protein VIV65_05430 [Gemmatimonadaceae bacterium]|jgi:hypothetical protein